MIGGSFFLGPACSIINLLIYNVNLPTSLVGQLCYTWAPIGSAIALYVGFSISNKKLAKPAAILVSITAPIYWYYLFIDSARTIESDIIWANATGNLIDIHLRYEVMLFIVIYLLTFLLILAGSFFWIANKNSGTIRKNALFQGMGYTGFVICGALDSLIDFSWFIVFVRLAMAGSFLLIYFSITKYGKM
ncbi:MAG: hypothetical protein GY870_16740 [archaeon]|nr:hypothetical protein [archaeon]